MIIRIWDYEKSAKGLSGGAALQKNAVETANNCARYILGLHLSSEQLDAAKTAGVVADYITSEHLESDRVLAAYASNLPSTKPAEQAAMFAVHVGSAGIDRLRHIVWSHRGDEPVDGAMMAQHRDIIARVMQIENCPMIGSDHGDTDQDHHHEAVATIDPVSGRRVEFGQGWWKEASQIAIAICEFQSELTPEPNRRYVADETGVYHTFSDTKVADAQGLILRDEIGQADRSVVREVQARHSDFKEENIPPDHLDPGTPWNIERAIKVLAGPRIEKARNWEEIHRNLARVGMRYVKVAGGAVIEIVGYGNPWDRTFPAGMAGSQATYGKLKTRRKFGDFVEPPSDLYVRPFVMPTYNDAEPDDTDQRERRQIREKVNELEDQLNQANRDAQATIYEAKLRDKTNDAIKAQALKAKREKSFAKSVARKLAARKRIKGWRDAEQPEQQEFHTIFSSGAESGDDASTTAKKARDKWLKNRTSYVREKIEYTTVYRKDGQIAFVESDNLVVIRSDTKQAKIDALLLAQHKFGCVKITASKRATAELIVLATELGIELDKSHEEQADRYRSKNMSGATTPRLNANARLTRANEILRSLRPTQRASRNRRKQSLGAFTDQIVMRLRTVNDIADERLKNINPGPDADKAAMRLFDTLPLDEVHLNSSLHQNGETAFVDDPVLRKHFTGNEHLLIRRQAQHTLEVFRLIEQQKRLWIVAALASKRVSIKDGKLNSSGAENEWAVSFYAGQKSDANFQRLLTIAQARPQRFTNTTMLNPGIAVWQKLCAENPPQTDRMQIMARILHRSTPKKDHRALLAALPEKDAKVLRNARDPMTKMLLDWPQTWTKNTRAPRRTRGSPGQATSHGST